MRIQAWWALLWVAGCAEEASAPSAEASSTVGAPVSPSFDAEGVAVAGKHGTLRLRVDGPPIDPRVDGARVTYERAGMTEVWTSSAAGLEQTFTVDRATPEIVVPIAVDGATVELVSDVGAILHGDTGDVTYGGLEAEDAVGKPLPARMEATGSGLRLMVDASEAVFPVTIDPVISAAMLTVEGNQASASMGYAVSGAGDVNGDGYDDVIVGAPYYDGTYTNGGAVLLYLGTATGVESSTPTTTLQGYNSGCSLGFSLSAAGDVNGDGYDDVVVGAPGYTYGQSSEGAVFVYFGYSGGLSPYPWYYESNQASSSFGYAVAGGGDVNGDGRDDIVVGAPNYDDGQSNEGAVFVFEANGSTLQSSPAFTFESNQASAHLGRSVAMGDVDWNGEADVVAGTPSWDNGQTDEGKVTTWLAPSFRGASVESNQAGAQLGYSVAVGDLNGDGFGDVVAGAATYDVTDNAGFPDAGAAFGYLGKASGLSTTAWGVWTVAQSGARWGSSVAVGDVNADGYDDVLVGAPYADDGQTDEGEVAVFAGGETLDDTVRWTLTSNQTGAHLGSSVAVTGVMNDEDVARDVVVGSPDFDDGQTNEGRIQLFDAKPSGPTDTYTSLDGDLVWFGDTVADLDGDGYDDLVYDGPAALEVRRGGVGGLGAVAWSSPGNAFEVAFGDFDGSGDLDVAAFFDWDGIEVDYDPVTAPAQSAAYLGADDYFASMVADLDGDGFDDLIVYDWDGAWVKAYFGSAIGLMPLPTWTDSGFVPVDRVPDLNGDGGDELVLWRNDEIEIVAGGVGGIGATLATAEGAPSRVVDLQGDGGVDLLALATDGLRVYHVDASGLTLTEVVAGVWDTAVADFDADGDLDLVELDADALGMHFVRGNANGFDYTPALAFHPPLTSTTIGAGDFDGDGYADLATAYNNGWNIAITPGAW